MSIDGPEDLTSMRAAADVARATLDALEAAVAPGVTTIDLDHIAAAVFAAHGGRSAPAMVYGFPGTVLISVNDEIVHGVPGPRASARGDLVKLDVTVDKDGYIADAARTVVVDGATPVAARLAACARAAFDAALVVARAGVKVNEIGRAIERVVRGAGFTVVRDLSGHGVGRTIHEPPDVPNTYNRFQRDVLTDGLVITIEPMISTGTDRIVTDKDGWTIRTKDGSLSAHHEHTLVITSGAPLVLTA